MNWRQLLDRFRYRSLSAAELSLTRLHRGLQASADFPASRMSGRLESSAGGLL